MILFSPNSRNEEILQNILGADNSLDPPQSRNEVLLQEILTSGIGSPAIETVAGATPTIAAADNHIYKCGEVTSITVSSIPLSGDFTVIFASGATPATFTEPSGMVMPDGFSVEANKRYEINVSDGYAVVASWAVS